MSPISPKERRQHSPCDPPAWTPKRFGSASWIWRRGTPQLSQRPVRSTQSALCRDKGDVSSACLASEQAKLIEVAHQPRKDLTLPLHHRARMPRQAVREKPIVAFESKL